MNFLKSTQHEYKTNPSIRMFVQLIEDGQSKLAWRLWRIELNRNILILASTPLRRLNDRNRKRWDDVRIDIEHFNLTRPKK